MQKLSEERSSYTIDDFILSCKEISVEEDIAYAIWDTLQKRYEGWIEWEYKPRLEDQLFDTLYLDIYDIYYDIIQPVLIACHIKMLPSPSETPIPVVIDTVKDVALFISERKKSHPL